MEEKMKRWVLKNAILGFATAIAIGAVSATSALAQVEQHSQISFQATALLTKDSTDQLPSNTVTKSGGLLLGYSYQFNRWAGAEGNYGYTRNTERYITSGSAPSLETNFHEVTGAFVVHVPANTPKVRPYALVGGGALVFDPTDRFVVAGTDRQTRGTFVYGGGFNFDITSNFGVRAEFRGLVYKVPDFGLDSLNLDKFAHLSQPSVGFFARF
jgi:opacity protein-like surface antigen